MHLKRVPELAHFEHPLSGEVCARRQVWENPMKTDDGHGSTPDGWGRQISVSVLLLLPTLAALNQFDK